MPSFESTISRDRYQRLTETLGKLIPIRGNKVPVAAHWNNPQEPSAQYSLGSCYGVMPHPHVLILDVDVKNGKEGGESYDRIATELGLSSLFDDPSVPQSLGYPAEANVITPSGGFHVYLDLRTAQGYSDSWYLQIPKHNPQYPGIDFITHGKAFTVLGGQELCDIPNNHGIPDAPNYIALSDSLRSILGDFTSLLGSQATLTPYEAKQAAKKAKYEELEENRFTGEDIQQLLQYINSDEYENWYKVAFTLMGSDLKRKQQFAIFDEWSSRSPKYTPDGCRAKWKRLQQDYDPDRDLLTAGSLVYLAKQEHPEAEAEINEIVKAAVNEKPQHLVGIYCDLQNRRSADHYYHIPTQSFHTEAWLKANLEPLFKHYSKGKKNKAKVQDLINNNDIVPVVGELYAPGKPYPFYTNEQGQRYVNTYSPANVPKPRPYETSKTVDFFVQHATQIFGKKYVNDFLSFIAFLTQNPGRKIKWMLVLQGGKGTGKGLLLNIVKTHVLGKTNCGFAIGLQIKSKYTAWAFEKQLVHIDELLISGYEAREAMETLKSIITEDSGMYEQKNISAHTRPNFTSFIALTNHKGCIQYADKRRYHCIISPIVDPKVDLDLRGHRSTVGYFSKLAELANKDNPLGGELRYFFENYQIPESFSPDERPAVSDFEAISMESAKTRNTEDLVELLRFVTGEDKLPAFASLTELHERCIETNPETGEAFFDEQIKVKQIKKLASDFNYSSYATWLYSNDINLEKVKEMIKKFNYPGRGQAKLSTKQALQLYAAEYHNLQTAAHDPQPTKDEDYDFEVEI